MPPMNPAELLALAKGLQAAGVNVFIGINVPVILDAGPADPQDPPPDPAPASMYVKVQGSKAVARFTRAQNAAGLPIFEIYPAPNSAPAARVIFSQDEVIEVLPEKVKGDGGEFCYQILDPDSVYPVALFLRAGDVIPAPQ